MYDVHLVRCNMVDKPKFQFGQMTSENSIVMSAVYPVDISGIPLFKKQEQARRFVFFLL